MNALKTRVLDTNALSEALKPSPSESSYAGLPPGSLRRCFVTTITQAEVLYGIELVAAGKRRMRLTTIIAKLWEEDFQVRILFRPLGFRAGVCENRRRLRGSPLDRMT